VVDVGVAEHDGVELPGVEGERVAVRVGVMVGPFQAAVQEDLLAAGLDQVHGAGYGPGGTPGSNGDPRPSLHGKGTHTTIVPVGGLKAALARGAVRLPQKW